MLLGGGLLQTADGRARRRGSRAGSHEVGPAITVRADDASGDRRRGAARARRARRRPGGAGTPAQRARGGGRTRRSGPAPEGGARWLRCASSRRRGSTPGRTRRPSTRSTCTSRTASSWCSSARRARARRPRCACSPGLEEVDAGGVLIGDRDVTYLPPKKRDVAMVFQNYALYPYLTVAAEHRLPAQDRQGREARARARACARWPKLLGLEELPRAQAGPALRRAAAARGHGPRDHPRAERVPDGRAALEPRREAARADARRHRVAAGRARRDDRLRDARPGRGDDARPPRRRAERRPAAAVRRAARALRAPGRTPSSPASSARPR